MALLKLNRSTHYYQSNKINPLELKLMNLIDEQYLKTPFYGSRRMAEHLKKLGHKVNRKRIQRLYNKMGLHAIYPPPNTSYANQEAKVYPYLLRGLKIDHKNMVWATDITYISMAKGYLYLCAIIDIHSRYVVHWDISNTMDANWVTRVLRKAVEVHGSPKIINSDQGTQFTSDCWINECKNSNIQISMDGKGRCIDNIFIERLWRSVKQECIYINPPENGGDLKNNLRDYFFFYNTQRPHQALKNETPENVYQQVA